MITFEELVAQEYIEWFPRAGGYSMCLIKAHPELSIQDALALADAFFKEKFEMDRQGSYCKWYVNYSWYAKGEQIPPFVLEPSTSVTPLRVESEKYLDIVVTTLVTTLDL